MRRTRVDRWTVVELVGAGLLGAGIWGQWGPWWSCMTWGGLLLAAATVQAVVEARTARRGREEG